MNVLPFVILPFVILPFVCSTFWSFYLLSFYLMIVLPFVILPFVILPFVILPFVILPFVLEPPKSLVLYICTYCTYNVHTATYSVLKLYYCLGTTTREDLYIADVSCMVARTTIYRIMQRRKRNYLPLHIPHQIPLTPGPPNDLPHLRMIIVGVLL